MADKRKKGIVTLVTPEGIHKVNVHRGVIVEPKGVSGSCVSQSSVPSERIATTKSVSSSVSTKSARKTGASSTHVVVARSESATSSREMNFFDFEDLSSADETITDDEIDRPNETISPRTAKKSTNKKTLFNLSKDVKLIKETIAVNPFQGSPASNASGWSEIASVLVAQFPSSFPKLLPKTARGRIALLIKKFKASQRLGKSRSGIEEVYGQYDEWLQQLVDMSVNNVIVVSDEVEQDRPNQCERPNALHAKPDDKVVGKHIRDSAMQGMCKRKADAPGPVPRKKQASKADVGQAFMQKMESDAKLREQQLQLNKDIQERQVATLEMEKLEKEQRWDLERREREQAMRLAEERCRQDRERAQQDREMQNNMINIVRSLIEKKD